MGANFSSFLSPKLTKQQQEQQQKFINIQELINDIDNVAKSNDSKLLGAIIADENSEFYSAGVNIGLKSGDSFTTMASENENLNNLAKTILASIFASWLKERKETFKIAEIGAGSGQLMKEIFAIKKQAIDDPNCELDVKDFFNSLNFAIVDFNNMIGIQEENFWQDSKFVKFYPMDIANNLLPANEFDFAYGNEIPDTQRVDFLEIKTDENGDKKFFLHAIKDYPHRSTGDLVEIGAELQQKIAENLLPIQQLEDATYLLQFGFHALLHNIKQSLKDGGDLMLVDYYVVAEDELSNSLRFCSPTGSYDDISLFLEKIDSPSEQIINAKKLYNGKIDITYSPPIGEDTCHKFGIACANFDPTESRSIFVYSDKPNFHDLEILYENSLLGKAFENSRSYDIVVMDSELNPARPNQEIIKDLFQPEIQVTSPQAHKLSRSDLDKSSALQ